MKRFMVIAKVNGQDYLTDVCAESAYGAEHEILDQGVCGKHEYGVEACMAYDIEKLNTECFVSHLTFAHPVSIAELAGIIARRNEEIKKRDEAENRMREIERQMKLLQEEYNKAQEIFTA